MGKEAQGREGGRRSSLRQTLTLGGRGKQEAGEHGP